jgi:hypothetical protein
MTDMKLFASKFSRVNSSSDLPSGLTQLRHRKQPYISLLLVEENPVMYR